MGYLINDVLWILIMKKICFECLWLFKNDYMLYFDIKLVEYDWILDII